ncbi:MAG: AAA family ATPase, partial [Leptolyngbya sp. SIO1D8]|nr:AAA family ATPase [Leptolyngbya sp. SIO1D8]
MFSSVANKQEKTPHDIRLETQSELISIALSQLGASDLTIEGLGQFCIQCSNGFTPQQEHEAWKFLRSNWRLLRKLNLEVPKKYLNHYELQDISEDGCKCLNLTKGTVYTLQWIGDDELSCECEAYIHGNSCNHVEYALECLNVAVPEALETPSTSLATLEASSSEEPEEPEDLPELLPGITATSDQSKELKVLLDFAHGNKSIHGLFGFAGAGKTLLLQAWLKRLRASGYDKPIVFTAPTNKAVSVLQSMVTRWGLNIECLTCAKLLGLRPHIDTKTGREYFKKAYGEESTIDSYSIVVIDEASMVGSADGKHDGLWELLTSEASLYTKLLFVGDYAQLPPIGEPLSEVFLSIQEPSMLTEVKRYDGAI